MSAARLLASVRCLLFGHVDREVRDARRFHLRCDECGRESPGWSLAEPAPAGRGRPRPSGEPGRSVWSMQGQARP